VIILIAVRAHAAAGNKPAMAEKKAYPLRINAEVLAAAQRWADDELRSLNAQIEYVLRDALRKAGRLKPAAQEPPKCHRRNCHETVHLPRLPAAGCIAVLQLARLLLGWDIVVNGYAVPLWASGVAAT
jgi:hypothetical protein